LNGERPDPQEVERIRREREARDAEETKRLAEKRAEAAGKAEQIWRAARIAEKDHPYLVRKRVKPVSSLRELQDKAVAAILGYAPKACGEALSGRLLVVPVKASGTLSTLELIDEHGRKSALAGGAKSGGYWAAQPLPMDAKDKTLLIGEGVATVLSTCEAPDILELPRWRLEP
jgi:putative DNA primase/helicase